MSILQTLNRELGRRKKKIKKKEKSINAKEMVFTSALLQSFC